MCGGLEWTVICHCSFLRGRKDERFGKEGKTVPTDEKPVFRGGSVDERAELSRVC